MNRLDSSHIINNPLNVATPLARVVAPTYQFSLGHDDDARKGRRYIQGGVRRTLGVALCALLLFLVWPHAGVSAAGLSTGHIYGRLLNGSHNNAPVANQSVTLQLAENNTARDLITLTTDAQGNYSFSALQSDSSVQYAIYTLYQNAQYTTDLIDLSKNANQQVDLTVYDATTSTANIAVTQVTILLGKVNSQTGMISISEDYFFTNLGNTTYAGTLGDGHSKPNALMFSLPTGAKLLSLGAGFDGYNSTQVDTGFATTAAILPGTSRFSFSFQVPYSGSSYHLTYKALYPTVLLMLLTPTNLQTTATDLTAKGPTNTKSDTYNSFQGKTLSANATIQAQLEGLPVPAPAKQQQTSLNPNLIWLVVLLIVLLALAGVGGYVYNTRRSKAANSRRRQNQSARKAAEPTRKKAAPVTKEALLQQLLELDRAFEARELKKAAYYERRSRLKAQLRELMEKEPASKRAEKRMEAPGKAASSGGKGEK